MPKRPGNADFPGRFFIPFIGGKKAALRTTFKFTMSSSKNARNKHGLPRTIPESIKRKVRQRCGFGCVICGIGLYEYEHFAPEYKDAKSHAPEGITLLCPNHHARKTIGRLSLETIK